MELKFEYSQKVADGHSPASFVDPDNTVTVFFTNENLKAVTATVGESLFGDVDFSDPVELYDPASMVNVKYLAGNFAWVVFLSDDYKIAVLPHVLPKYVDMHVDDIHKLYYATDRQLLLWNVDNNWRIALTPLHGWLKDIKTGNPHPQYIRNLEGEELPQPTEEYRGERFLLKSENGDEICICLFRENGFQWIKVGGD